VLKLWVVEIDKGRRRVSLTAIPPGSARPPRPKREERPQPPPRPRQPQQQRPQRDRSQQPRPQQSAGGPGSGRPQQGPPPPRQRPAGRRPQGGQPRRDEGPRVIERPATKPKVVKPLTKAQEEGKKPLRSFSDLMQLMDKKKEKKPEAGGAEPMTNDQ
jgi:uncharacterized protein